MTHPPDIHGTWAYDGFDYAVEIRVNEEKLLTQIGTACNRSDGTHKMIAGAIIITAKKIGKAEPATTDAQLFTDSHP